MLPVEYLKKFRITGHANIRTLVNPNGHVGRYNIEAVSELAAMAELKKRCHYIDSILQIEEVKDVK